VSDLPEKELDSGLRAAFHGDVPDHSVLKALDARPLRLAGADVEPATDRTGRYQTVGEIARGGVGVVFKGRDVDLGRDVAIKVLRDELKEDPSVSERFVEEAQIGGQLQHPGIVPVYELGLDDQNRPYFSMKLVKGKTLAARMKEGALSPRRLLGIFEKVCETMAYAHARGVVHRDLKPANIMLGAFGEVQIVDWGFAKVLREGGIADEKARPEVSVIATVRSAGEGSESIAGSVMGTPAYMPPEQALGQVEALDETSDVFSLGAILFQILTGTKLYEKRDNDNLLVLAAQCQLDEQLALLMGHDLEDLVRRCLAVRQSDRPKNAAEVERAISAHLASVEERAQAARVAAAEARVRARGERRKRALTLVLGAAVLGVVVLTGGGWWLLEQRARVRAEERARIARAAIDEATLLVGRSKFREAVDAARRAVEIDDSKDARSALALAQRELAADEQRRAQKRKDDAFEAEIASVFTPDRYPEADDLFSAAFRNYGVATGDVEAWGRVRPQTRLAASVAMVEWARVRRGNGEAPEAWQPLLDTAARLDADPLHQEIRDASMTDDASRLTEIALREDPAKLLPPSVAWLGWCLMSAGSPQSVAWLRRGRDAHPAEASIQWLLGYATTGHESIEAFTAALARTPDSVTIRVLLGYRLRAQGPERSQDAVDVWRDAVRLQSKQGHGDTADLVYVQWLSGDREGALAKFEEGIRKNPDDYRYYKARAVALDQVRPAQAIEDYEKSLELRDTVYVRCRLAMLLANTAEVELRDPQEAIRQAEAAIRLAVAGKDKSGGYPQLTLGFGCYRAGRFQEALEAVDGLVVVVGWTDIYLECLKAMAYWQLGNEAEARQWLAAANARASGGFNDLWGHRTALLAEARELVK